MAENLFNSNHKSSNKAYREGWKRIWGKKKLKNEVSDKKNQNFLSK